MRIQGRLEGKEGLRLSERVSECGREGNNEDPSRDCTSGELLATQFVSEGALRTDADADEGALRSLARSVRVGARILQGHSVRRRE